MDQYDGRLTLWVPFLALQDGRDEESDCAVVSEANYVRLHQQLQGAVETCRVLRAWMVAKGVEPPTDAEVEALRGRLDVDSSTTAGGQ